MARQLERALCTAFLVRPAMSLGATADELGESNFTPTGMWKFKDALSPEEIETEKRFLNIAPDDGVLIPESGNEKIIKSGADESTVRSTAATKSIGWIEGLLRVYFLTDSVYRTW